MIGNAKLTKFFELVAAGFRQPDYLAREIFPEIYDSNRALVGLKCGRFVGASATIAALAVLDELLRQTAHPRGDQ
jgi:hypothetical protein